MSSLQSGAEGSTGYLSRLFTLVSTSATQLISAPSQPHRTEARRRLARHTLLTFAVAAVLIAVLMIWFDAQEIALMPPRGTASLWPIRILTDFGKDNYVLLLLAVLLLAVALIAPAMLAPRSGGCLRSVCVCNSCCSRYLYRSLSASW